MSKSALYAVNTSGGAVTANGTISFPTIVRRFGQSVSLFNNSVAVGSGGYYSVTVSISGTATSATALAFTLEQDGNAVPGATATFDPAATGDAFTVAISAIVRTFCEPSALTVVAGGAFTLTTASVEVVKL